MHQFCAIPIPVRVLWWPRVDATLAPFSTSRKSIKVLCGSRLKKLGLKKFLIKFLRRNSLSIRVFRLFRFSQKLDALTKFAFISSSLVLQLSAIVATTRQSAHSSMPTGAQDNSCTPQVLPLLIQ